jgi:hypothetical protein
MPERYISVSGARKTIFGPRYGLPDFTFLFLVELGAHVQNLIFTKVVEWLPKKKNSAKGYAEIGLKIQMVETCSSAYFIHRNFYFWKTLKSQFLAEFQSFISGQIWADFPSFTVAESMPKLGLKFSKPHNFSTVSPNVTFNGSLESYHPYL